MLKRLEVTHKPVFGVDKGVWSDEKRVEAVNAYLIYGNMAEVSRITGIPVDTLRDWRKFKPWWKELENVLKEEHDMGVAGELSSVVDKTIKAISDRVQNGDFIYNMRSGEIQRVPVSAASLNKIAGTLIDKKLTLQKQPTKYTQVTDSKTELNNKLETLATAFAKFTKGHVGKVVENATIELDNATDIEPVVSTMQSV